MDQKPTYKRLVVKRSLTDYAESKDLKTHLTLIEPNTSRLQSEEFAYFASLRFNTMLKHATLS